MNYMLSQIENWKRCNAGAPHSYQMEAVVEAVKEGWDYLCIEATVERGVADADRENIAECIAEHGLDCTVEECVAALLASCKSTMERVAAERVEDE